MSALGIFAAAQPIYAERGVPTFPVRIDGKDKRPAVRGYDRVGLSGSEQLVLRFGDADGIGFMSRRSTSTVPTKVS